MTDNFLQKLEDKVMILLAELETMRKELSQLRQENSLLKAEKLTYTKKLQGLVALLDSLAEPTIVMNDHTTLMMQEEYSDV